MALCRLRTCVMPCMPYHSHQTSHAHGSTHLMQHPHDSDAHAMPLHVNLHGVPPHTSMVGAPLQCPHCTPELKSPAYDRIHYRMHTHDSDTMQYTMQHTLHYHITPKRKALPGRAHCSLTPPVPLPAHLTANPYHLHMSACITSYIHMP